jgi:hypothetical protein
MIGAGQIRDLKLQRIIRPGGDRHSKEKKEQECNISAVHRYMDKKR